MKRPAAWMFAIVYVLLGIVTVLVFIPKLAEYYGEG